VGFTGVLVIAGIVTIVCLIISYRKRKPIMEAGRRLSAAARTSFRQARASLARKFSTANAEAEQVDVEAMAKGLKPGQGNFLKEMVKAQQPDLANKHEPKEQKRDSTEGSAHSQGDDASVRGDNIFNPEARESAAFGGEMSNKMSFGKGNDEERAQEMEMVDNRWTVKRPEGQHANPYELGGTRRNNFFGSVELSDLESLPPMSRGLTVIRGLLDRIEDDPELDRSEVLVLRTQRSDAAFTNIAASDFEAPEEKKEFKFLDLIGETKALLCEMNLIDQKQVEGGLPQE
jgi:hypothetical protein